jgi:ligand-binding sensor domain-containing protein/signal transduction histidine kinase
MKAPLSLLLFLFLAFNAQSQPSGQYTFTHYRLSHGLASNIVNNAVQDEKGFLWLATNNGLQRFDGNRFITFKSDRPKPYALPYDEVAQVYLDQKRNLWVFTVDNKVGIFDTRTLRYTDVPLPRWQGDNTYADKNIVETTDGRLLLYVKKTAFVFEYDTAARKFASVYIDLPHGWKLNSLVQDKVTKKFLMTTDLGFAVYNPATRTLNYEGANPENDPLIVQLGAERYLNYIYIDTNRRLFYEQWPPAKQHPVLKMLDLKSGTRQQYDLKREYGLGYHQIKGLMQQRNGMLWIYGLPFLAQYTSSPQPIHFLKKDYNKEKDLKFKQVFSMYEDRQRNIWVCTDYGLYLFNPDTQLFQNHTLATTQRHLVEGHAQTALQFKNGDTWVGFRDLGLHRFDRQFRELPIPKSIVPLQQEKSVWDIHQHSKNGMVWIALQGGKLIVYDTATKNARLLAPAAFEQRAITQIAEDKRGNLWFGTQGGRLVKWVYRPGMPPAAEGFLPVAKAGIIEKLFADSRGNIWVAAFGTGLLKIDAATNAVSAAFSGSSNPGFALWNNNPKDIIQYNDSLLIVAGGALNILNINTNKIRHISQANGLPTNTVQSLATDASGVLWLGTLNGLCRADLNKHSFTVFNQSDGLLNEFFNVGGAHNLNGGRLLFTSAESFVVINPEHIKKKALSDKAVITDMRLMNRSLHIDSLLALKQLRLPYNKTNLVIEFSALNFDNLNKLDYYYQLEGFDSAWVKSDDRHQAVYTYLPPGNYTFRVRTKSLTGMFGAASVPLLVKVAPPFWNTWWFYALVIMLAALLLYLIDRERMKRLVVLHNVRSEIAGHLHQDVSTTLNNINVLSQIAKLKADKDIGRSKELIDEISGKSYNMMMSMDEILWSIDPGNDTMSKTLLRIDEFAETLKANCGTSVDIVVHEKVKDLKLSMKMRHDFFIICKEALRTLAQCAKDQNIMVDIDLVRSRIVLKILSVGVDTDEAAANMQALKKTMTEKAADLHASLNFEIGKRDTSIFLSMPVT